MNYLLMMPLSLLLITGCFSEEEKSPTQVVEKVQEVIEQAPQKEVQTVQESKPTIIETKCSVEEQFFPNWACEEKKGLYIAVGMSSNNKEGALSNATTLLQEDLDRIISTKLEKYMSSLGLKDSEKITTISKNVAKKTIEESLNDFQKLEDEKLNGKLFVQLGIEKSSINAKVKKIFKEAMQQTKKVEKSPMQSDEVLYQQFQAQKALDSL